jgi:secreted trypsin-like serine protease
MDTGMGTLKMKSWMSCFMIALASGCGEVQPDEAGSRLPENAVSTGEQEIVNGTRAEPGQFPWQVALTERVLVLDSFFCGGVLIDKRWVLTAAHCVVGTSAADIAVALGGTSRLNLDQRIEVKQVIVHPDYDSVVFRNDIALLELSADAVEQGGRHAVQTIPLQHEELADGVVCTESGWGKTSRFAPTAIDLMYTRNPKISNEACSQQWGFLIKDSQLCVRSVSSPHHGGCNGDSGGPLVATTQGVTRVVGLVSFGSSACDGAAPDAFTKVSAFVSWINTHTGLAL